MKKRKLDKWVNRERRKRKLSPVKSYREFLIYLTGLRERKQKVKKQIAVAAQMLSIQKKVPVTNESTLAAYTTLNDRLTEEYGELVMEWVDGLHKGEKTPMLRPNEELRYESNDRSFTPPFSVTDEVGEEQSVSGNRFWFDYDQAHKAAVWLAEKVMEETVFLVNAWGNRVWVAEFINWEEMNPREKKYRVAELRMDAEED